MSQYSRRDFIRAGAAAGALASLESSPLTAEKKSATEWVTLGKSKVKVTRLALGTGTFSGGVQRRLGQEDFNRLVHYAYDRGIRFFETADSYADMHTMLGIALKPFPRDSYRLMTKVTTADPIEPRKRIDDLRRQAQTEYFDIALLHWQHTSTWPEDTKRWQEGLMKAQASGSIRSHGASVHGLPALRQVPDFSWLEVALIRVNHKGVRMDTEDYTSSVGGDVPVVVKNIQAARQAGLGVIGMKLAGEGTFGREDRQKAMRFAFQHAGVDAVTVGYRSPAEIDEAIENLNLAFA
jgi:aryl-alcohol dehydrogenase-like predicted oxidoreductase